MTRRRIETDAPREAPGVGPVACLMVDGARRSVVWEAIGAGNGRQEGEASYEEWAGWPEAVTAR